MKRYLWILCLIAILPASRVVADETEKEYAKASLNGLKVNRYAKHIAVPVQTYFNVDDQKTKTQSIVYLKPVVPFRITPDFDLIIRTIAPIYERTPKQHHYVNGWGDINPTFFITPKRYDVFLYGIGPSISIPTSTNSEYIGTGKWSVGPELAFYYIDENWLAGFLTSNLWSVAGDANRSSVNAFQFQYQVAYTFDRGWFIASNPTITANWKSPGNQQWTVPFGLGGGRVVKWGRQPINIALYGNYNAIRPAHVGPTWQAELNIEWLFQPGFVKV